MKSFPIQRKGKFARERRVLIGLIEYYIKTGKPVGSSTLKEEGFEDLSSATIRNYFAHLEEEGFLIQQHASGGRIPSQLAFKFYANESQYAAPAVLENYPKWEEIHEIETPEISRYLQSGAELLSQTLNCAVFLSAPRFDHDFVTDIKLVGIDQNRCLSIIITNFGIIKTEILHTSQKLTTFAIKRMEAYFHWRLTGLNKPEDISSEEEKTAQAFYNELMVRYLIGYSTFVEEEIYRTGFSRLLTFHEFLESTALATTLSLFENIPSMRLLLKECLAQKKLKFWIGEDLKPFSSTETSTVIAVPYHINVKTVGAIGILCPMRIPYPKIFSALKLFSEIVSNTLTRNIYKYQIHFRQPQKGVLYLQKEDQSRLKLLEKK